MKTNARWSIYHNIWTKYIKMINSNFTPYMEQDIDGAGYVPLFSSNQFSINNI